MEQIDPVNAFFLFWAAFLVGAIIGQQRKHDDEA